MLLVFSTAAAVAFFMPFVYFFLIANLLLWFFVFVTYISVYYPSAIIDEMLFVQVYNDD